MNNFPSALLIITILLKSALADDYPDIVGPSAPLITVNTAVSGVIDIRGDVDVLQAKLLRGRAYMITMQSISPAFDNQLILYDSSGNQIAENNDLIGSNAGIETYPTTTGYYYIKAKASTSFGFGSYALAVADTTPCSAGCSNCQAAPLSPCTICGTGYQCLACVNTPSAEIVGGTCYCYPGETFGSNTCLACSSLDSNCIQCSSTSICTACSGSLLTYGSRCVSSCPAGSSYQVGMSCLGCNTLHTSCTACNSSITCTQCSGGLVALGGGCAVSCPGGTFNNGGLCTSCKTLGDYCTSCNSSISCTGCSNSKYALGSNCVDSCPGDTFINSGVCTSCKTLNVFCTTCNSSVSCTSCSNSKFALGSQCVDSCPYGTFATQGICTSCKVLDDYCTNCNSSSSCTGCSIAKYALGSRCVDSCPGDTFINSGVCTSCKTLNGFCATCNSSVSCTSCSNSKFALGSQCVDSCPYGTFAKEGICTSCATLDDDCLGCNGTSHCTQCSGRLVALGPMCIDECPPTTYDNIGVCTSCATLDNSCTSCNSSVSCLGCSGGLLAFGPTCTFPCPIKTYDSNGLCLSCKTLDDYCLECSNNRFCSLCDNKMLIFYSNCVTKCPSGTQNTEGICSNTVYKISLSYTDSARNYLVQFPAALVSDVNVPQVSTVTLEGVNPLAYNYTLTKRSNTVYQINLQVTKSIPSTTLKFTYFLNASTPTNNPLIGKWIGEIITKYEGYMSEADRAAVEAINKAIGGAMQGATSGAGSMAILGGNPALLWPLLNLFQTFYYLIFVDVNYPANVQMFLKIFSLGSLSFLPNPLEWFVQDIDKYELSVPPRYNDYNFTGLFLENSGNELLLLALVFGLYLISKGAKKWLRRLPNSLRTLTNKTVGWFEWSGILRSLITSYTDMAQAIFLQMRALTFYSTVFMLSSVLTFMALGFVLIFPVMIFFIIKGFDKHPELLYVKYDTLVQEYDAKKKAGRYFIPIWLVRRLVMCLSLVFLQGYPYMQINILCILVIGTIIHSWVYTPYTTKKENICNTIMEILFGCIHAVIYILVYDDHNPHFSEEQRLQMGWMIIFACGVILMISMGLNIIEQVKEVIRGIKLLRELVLSKSDDKKKKRRRNQRRKTQIRIASEQSEFIDLNKTPSNVSDSPPLNEENFVRVNQGLIRRIPLSEVRRQRKERLAVRIGELRQINKSPKKSNYRF